MRLCLSVLAVVTVFLSSFLIPVIDASAEQSWSEMRREAEHQQSLHEARQMGAQNQGPSAADQMLAEALFVGFLMHSQQQLAASAEANGPLLPPSEAKYSTAGPLLAGKTLLIDGGQPVYFAANGIAAAEDPKTGQRYRWDWRVRGNNACLMFADGGLGCFEFQFSKKKKLAGIIDADGKLSENFQILGADIMGFSDITG